MNEYENAGVAVFYFFSPLFNPRSKLRRTKFHSR